MVRGLYNIRFGADHCPYCGNLADTKDHVPSKGFLDEPYPKMLRVIPCCKRCNSSFSLDEEYAFCAIECYVCRSLKIEDLERVKVQKILEHSPSILYGLVEQNADNNSSNIKIDWNRVGNAIKKNLIGHAYFELGTDVGNIEEFWVKPLDNLSITELSKFLSDEYPKIVPEIGSRLSQHQYVISEDGKNVGHFVNTWHVIDEKNYKYFVCVESKTVKAVIRGKIAAFMRFQ